MPAGPEKAVYLDEIEPMYADTLFEAAERAGRGESTEVIHHGAVVAMIVPAGRM
jgi:hypothetical protein